MVQIVEAAVLDSLWGTHAHMGDRFIDASLRSPLAQEFVTAAALRPAAAAMHGDAEKMEHYPARQGCRVTPWCSESFGRLSPVMEGDLEALAPLAGEQQAQFGPGRRRWLRSWRSRLSHLIARLVATGVEQCLDGRALPGEDAVPCLSLTAPGGPRPGAVCVGYHSLC